MNIAMEQTEEYVDGQLTSKYGDCFIRGNNGKCVCRNETLQSCNLVFLAFCTDYPSGIFSSDIEKYCTSLAKGGRCLVLNVYRGGIEWFDLTRGSGEYDRSARV